MTFESIVRLFEGIRDVLGRSVRDDDHDDDDDDS